jgi:hypothetical protein
VKPVEAYAEVGGLLELTVKRVYREEPLTEAELDEWTDRILKWAAEQKGQANGERREST